MLGFDVAARVALDAEGFEERLLGAEEMNDSLIIAKAALLECWMLVSGDAHLRGVDFQRLTLLLQDFHVAVPVIATPPEIVRKFFR